MSYEKDEKQLSPKESFGQFSTVNSQLPDIFPVSNLPFRQPFDCLCQSFVTFRFELFSKLPFFPIAYCTFGKI